MPKASNHQGTPPRRRLLTEAEAAEYLGLAPQTLNNARANGSLGLPWVKLGGRSVRYDSADIDAFIESRKQGGPAA